MASLWELVGDHIPDDHSRQVHSKYYIEETMTAPDAPTLVVDLGCGNGVSTEWFRACSPDVTWVGVDIVESDNARKLGDEQVVFYDGIHLPFRTDSLPLIYSNQVFEHVRYPEPLLAEVRRVLRPGGVFIGSTSQLEPYHAWSIWNYTVYGFKLLVEAAGLVLEEVRPGIDGIALAHRQWFGRRPEHSAWFARSPLNGEIDEWGAANRRRPAQINLRKLQFCGHFSFRVRKPYQGAEMPLPWRRDAARAAVTLDTAEEGSAGADAQSAEATAATGGPRPTGRAARATLRQRVRRFLGRGRLGRVLRRIKRLAQPH